MRKKAIQRAGSRQSQGQLTTLIINQCKQYPAPRSLLLRILFSAYCDFKQEPATVNLLLVNDQDMKKFNQEYKGRSDSTDVLAFDDHEIDPVTKILHLGEIIVSVDTARCQASLRHMRIRDEVTLYALHGLLHLLGMRDGTTCEQQAMMQKQSEIFLQYGLNLTYE